jgi:hypothetical protein
MWIASTIGWFGVVRDRQTKGGVLVRARAEADIRNLFRRFGNPTAGYLCHSLSLSWPNFFAIST